VQVLFVPVSKPVVVLTIFVMLFTEQIHAVHGKKAYGADAVNYTDGFAAIAIFVQVAILYCTSLVVFERSDWDCFSDSVTDL